MHCFIIIKKNKGLLFLSVNILLPNVSYNKTRGKHLCTKLGLEKFVCHKYETHVKIGYDTLLLVVWELCTRNSVPLANHQK